MPPRLKRKDWLTVIIGGLTVLLGAEGVFMPDWVKDGTIAKWEAYAILGAVVLLILLCLLLLQLDVRKAEVDAENRERTREKEADDAKLREDALATDISGIKSYAFQLEIDMKDMRERDARREAREIKQIELLHEWLLRDIRAMETNPDADKKRLVETKIAANFFKESLNVKQDEIAEFHTHTDHTFGLFDNIVDLSEPSTRRNAPDHVRGYHPRTAQSLADSGFKILRTIIAQSEEADKKGQI